MTKENKRAIRRHHRERVIRKRYRDAANIAVCGVQDSGPHPKGALADNQYWLGCNKPNCGLCHMGEREEKKRERQQAKSLLREEI